jgi:hypothetical protein
MGMVGYYLQASPDQVKAIKSSQLGVNHSTFRVGGSLTPLQPPVNSLMLGLALVGAVGITIWFAWVRHLNNRGWRWALSMALVAAALTAVGIGSKHHKHRIVVSTAPVSEPLRIDKSWHGIHFLLTGSAWGGKPPLFNVVLGGKKFGRDLGYEGAHYLTPDEVKEVAAALEEITEEVLRARFDPKAMTKARIYCWLEEEGAEGLEYFLHYYGLVRAYFQDAARRGNGMLISIT